jgi:hypothetical protein
VDFHALRNAHGNIYGWDAGTGGVMVSVDEGRLPRPCTPSLQTGLFTGPPTLA